MRKGSVVFLVVVGVFLALFGQFDRVFAKPPAPKRLIHIHNKTAFTLDFSATLTGEFVAVGRAHTTHSGEAKDLQHECSDAELSAASIHIRKFSYAIRSGDGTAWACDKEVFQKAIGSIEVPFGTSRTFSLKSRVVGIPSQEFTVHFQDANSVIITSK